MKAAVGAGRLARFDRSGFGYFEASAAACARSFFAAALLAPLFAVRVAFEPGDGAPHDSVRYIVVSLIAYVVSWTAYPVVIHPIVTAIGRGDRYFAYVTAYNWSQIVQYALAAVLVLLMASGLLAGGAASVAALGVFAFVLAYVWFIAREALGVTGPQAAMLVAVDVALSYLTLAVAANLE